ncbi:MAG: amidase family protein, partial [Candidatus Omnitrophota bacterium]
MEDFISSIDTFRRWLEKRAESFSETVRFLSDRIREKDKGVHAFIALDENCLQAKAAQLEQSAGKGRLWGVPVGIKSNICVKGEPATCASRILENFRPPYNAAVIERLAREGALLLSGLNMDEFAFGSSCETSFFGPTRNPWDLSRIPGGSSGGSAAAVAAGEVVAALGSDTGGSIRQPASMCGVVGMKPTYGRVSRYGLIAFASSLDQIGPITRNVTDCAVLLEIISGYDHRDSTSVEAPVPEYTENLNKNISGMVIGIPGEYCSAGIDAGVKKCLDEAVNVLKKLGARIIDVSLPHTKYAVSCYYIIGPAEASSNLARYDGMHYGYRAKNCGGIIDMYSRSRSEGFGAEAKRRVLLGTYCLSSGYYDAYYL